MLKIFNLIFNVLSKNFYFVMFLACTITIDSTKICGQSLRTDQTYGQYSCFIMHADDDPYLAEIEEIVNSLQSITCLKVTYARNGEDNGLAFGEDMNEFMRNGIRESDFVITFYSPTFYKRSENSFSGISFELRLLLDRLQEDKNAFFIPFLLTGCDEKCSIPTILRNYLAVKSNAQELISTISKRMLCRNRMHQPKSRSNISETIIALSSQDGSTQNSQATVLMSSSHNTPGSLGTHLICMSSGSL